MPSSDATFIFPMITVDFKVFCVVEYFLEIVNPKIDNLNC